MLKRLYVLYILCSFCTTSAMHGDSIEEYLADRNQADLRKRTQQVNELSMLLNTQESQIELLEWKCQKLIKQQAEYTASLLALRVIIERSKKPSNRRNSV